MRAVGAVGVRRRRGGRQDAGHRRAGAAPAARWRRRALALGMRAIVNQTRATSELAEEWRVEQVGLRDLLARADFVSLHVPMRAANRNLIGAPSWRS